jgi:hypothetical protein
MGRGEDLLGGRCGVEAEGIRKKIDSLCLMKCYSYYIRRKRQRDGRNDKIPLPRDSLKI